MSAAKKYTVAVDFDGVLHSYTSPWVAAHVIPDAPVDGALSWLFLTIQEFEVIIFTTRGKSWRGRRAVRAWLRAQAPDLWSGGRSLRGLESVRVTATKEAALVYLDDRAMRFDGANFPAPNVVHALRPWNKPRPSSSGVTQP